MLNEVRLMSAGFCLHPELMSIQGGSWRPCKFPAGFALIQHSVIGPVLYDTGYGDQFWAETKSFPNSLYARAVPPTFGDIDRASHQLKQMGIQPSDVRAVIVSHFHADHIAGLRDFPRAEIICTSAGWRSIASARGMRGILKGLLPGLMPTDANERLSFADTKPSITLPSSLSAFGRGYDLLSDGSVIGVDLPGHAVGQMGIYIPQAPQGSLFLVADAAWSLTAIEEMRLPPSFVVSLLGRYDDYLKTLSALHHLRQHDNNVSICPAHCTRVYSC